MLGCYYCLSTFDEGDIVWASVEVPLCPFCEIDAVTNETRADKLLALSEDAFDIDNTLQTELNK